MIAYCILISFAISYVLSGYLLKNADKFHIGKRVYNERVRLHRSGVPRLGGITIYISFYITLLLVFLMKRDFFNGHETKMLGIFLASTIITGFGLYDDIVKRLSYKIKFAAQIIAILMLIYFGYRIDIITNPFGGAIEVGVFGGFFVALWMLMIMNAINLIDGLDGLACGIAIMISISFFVVGLAQGNILSFPITAALIGASLAFLAYNFYPAKLFLGDSGSFFIGFMLGILAMESATKRATVISLVVPLLTLFIPIASVVFTFSRRVALAKNPFKPDRMHLHYRFLRAGVSHRDTVLIYYSVTFLYTMLGTICFFMPKNFELMIITFGGIAMWLLYMWALHFISSRTRSLRRSKK